MEKVSPQLIVLMNQETVPQNLKVIIRYYGDIEAALRKNLRTDYIIYFLLQNFAILDISYDDFNSLMRLDEIIYIDNTNYMNWI